MPEFIQEQASVWKLLGEQYCNEEQWKSNLSVSSLNEVYAKLNADSFQASFENTFNDTFEAEQNVCQKLSCVEDWDYSHALMHSKWSEVEFEIKPWDISFLIKFNMINKTIIFFIYQIKVINWNYFMIRKNV